MFTIGEFSRITGLTVKALRFYHEQGLLTPTCVDEQTGYRYYDPAKVELARTIAFLKSLDFSLDEIGELMAGAGSEAELAAALLQQRGVIDERIRRLKLVRRSLDEFLQAHSKGQKLMTAATFECEEKTVPPLKVAAVRMHAPYQDCGLGFAKIGKAFWSKIAGPALLLCHDSEYQEIANYEACLPIKSGQSRGEIDVRDLPGGRCVALLHRGPYDTLSRSYEKALAYVKSKGYQLVPPSREIYLKCPGMIFKGNPQNYLTEIQLMIEEAANPSGT